MATIFMNLELPEVLQTLGPEWATEINAAFETVDEHDHSSGKGVTIKTAGISINSDLTFNNYSATNVKTLKFQNLTSTQTGVLNSTSTYAVSGDLYYTNSSGVAVQITDGGSLVSTPSAVESYGFTTATGSLVISPSDTFVVVAIDTNAPRTITLPLASSVVAGRIYILKDKTGLADSNNITVAIQGSDTIDLQSSLTVSSPFASTELVSDGVSNWLLV
jgi:hypothetical protein